MAKLLVSALALLISLTDAAAADRRPQRIVSTNYCTDQIVLRLVEPERIASLTYLSWKPDQTAPELRPALRTIKQNRGLAEEVLTLKPDLIVGGHYSARFSNDLLARLGNRILLQKPETTFAEWYENVRELGVAVGEPKRAEKLIADFRRDLAALEAQISQDTERPIYANLEVNNWMPGKDTLYTQVVNAGGFRTAGEALGFSGYRTIPVEQLFRIHADLISSRSNSENPPAMATQNLHHPLLRRMASSAIAEIDIPSRYSACTTPETLKMIAMLVQARQNIDAVKRARSAPTYAK